MEDDTGYRSAIITDMATDIIRMISKHAITDDAEKAAACRVAAAMFDECLKHKTLMAGLARALNQ